MERWHLLVLLALAVACARARTRGPTIEPEIREARGRAPVSGDPLVDPSKPRISLPAAAFTDRKRGGSFADHERTRWDHSTLSVAGVAERAVVVGAPSIVLVRASWREDADLAVSVIANGVTLGSGNTIRRPDGHRLATVRVKVPSAGEVLIRTTGGQLPVSVDLHVGILEVSSPP